MKKNEEDYIEHLWRIEAYPLISFHERDLELINCCIAWHKGELSETLPISKDIQDNILFEYFDRDTLTYFRIPLSGYFDLCLDSKRKIF